MREEAETERSISIEPDTSDTDVLTRMALQLAYIQERNRRVEFEKGWETSATRRCAIAALTYLVVFFLFLSIGVPAPHIQAIIPTIGYCISTLSVPFLKRWWIARVERAHLEHVPRNGV